MNVEILKLPKIYVASPVNQSKQVETSPISQILNEERGKTGRNSCFPDEYLYHYLHRYTNTMADIDSRGRIYASRI